MAVLLTSQQIFTARFSERDFVRASSQLLRLLWTRAGLTIMPVVPWLSDQLPNFYHHAVLTFERLNDD